VKSITIRIRRDVLEKIKEEQKKGDVPFTSTTTFLEHLLREYLKNKEKQE